MLGVLPPLISLASPAYAGPVPAASISAYDQAEYYRLTQELHSLARRQAWEGVERAYEAIEKLTVEPSFDDHKAAAHAASARGDLFTAHRRLKAAHSLQEDREVIEWLWNLDTKYIEVHIETQPGSVLSAEQMPFDPHAFMAVAYAISEVEEDGAHQGYLPAGIYEVSGEIFEVRVGDPAFTLDLVDEDEQTGRGQKKKRR